MDIFISSLWAGPEESYSRQLDNHVKTEEKPYGYVLSPPPADSGDYDMRARESRKEYPHRRYGQ